MNRESNFYITPKLLRQRGACDYTVRSLQGVFGVGDNDRVFLTEDNVRRLLESHEFQRVTWPAYNIRASLRKHGGGDRLQQANRLYTKIERMVYSRGFGSPGNMFNASPATRGKQAKAIYDLLTEMSGLLYQAREETRRRREDNYALAA